MTLKLYLHEIRGDRGDPFVHASRKMTEILSVLLQLWRVEISVG